MLSLKSDLIAPTIRQIEGDPEVSTVESRAATRIYLAYVQPFQQYLTVKVKGSGRSDHIWANEYGP
jgi:hypothetical protein